MLFFVPYLATVLTHYFIGTGLSYSGGYYGGYASTAPLWPLTFIPIVHNLAMIGNSGGGAAVAMWVVGFLAGVLEISGLAALIVGERGHEEPVTEPRFSFVPSSPDADLGASWVLSF